MSQKVCESYQNDYGFMKFHLQCDATVPFLTETEFLLFLITNLHSMQLLSIFI